MRKFHLGLVLCLLVFGSAFDVYGVSDVLRSELATLERIESDEKLQPELFDHQLRAASLAMMEGERGIARDILSDATARLSGLIGGKDFARHEKQALRTLGGREEAKYFLGDPYEHVFAFLYLGILDYQAGEFELARSSFRSALIADEGSRQEGYKSDCYLAFLLEGLSNIALDRPDLATEAFDFAVGAYRSRSYMPALLDAFIKGSEKNYQSKMSKKETQRADAILSWVSEFSPGHLGLSMDPKQAIEDSFASAIDSLSSPEKDSPAADFLSTFRSKSNVEEATTYLLASKGYVLGALDQGRISTADSAIQEFSAVIDRIRKPETNLIVLTQAGLAPCKTRAGGHGEALHFREYPMRLDRQVFLAEDQSTNQLYYSSSRMEVAGEPVGESVGFQARTRGGRDMDQILASQARVKDNLYLAADVADEFGAIGAIISLGLQVAALSVHAEADTRGWNELPAELWLVSGSVPPGKYNYKSLGFDSFLDPVSMTETAGSFDVSEEKKAILLCGHPWRLLR